MLSSQIYERKEYMKKTESTPIFAWNEDLLSQDVICHFWNRGDVGLHSHKFYEFFLVTEGRIIHTFCGKDELISAGTLFLVTPGNAHKFSRYCGEESVHFNMKISPELFLALSDADGRKTTRYPYFKRNACPARCQDTPAASALWERRRNIDCFETLMGRTEDRVVRSILTKLLSTERLLCRRLEAVYDS